MNTGFLGSAVATVLTVYGIETQILNKYNHDITMLQQCLPFTVLKRVPQTHLDTLYHVATVLTVYGIETSYVL